MKRTFYTAAVLTLALGSCGDSEKLNADGDKVMAGSVAGGQKGVAIDMSAGNMAAGKALYQSNCAPCHGSGGKGDGPASVALNPKPRNHCDGDYMDKLSNDRLCNVIKMGGAMYGFPTMPAQPQLSDGQIQSIVAFMRSLSKTYKQ